MCPYSLLLATFGLCSARAFQGRPPDRAREKQERKGKNGTKRGRRESWKKRKHWKMRAEGAVNPEGFVDLLLEDG